jgi:diphthine-ammonia ligase
MGSTADGAIPFAVDPVPLHRGGTVPPSFFGEGLRRGLRGSAVTRARGSHTDRASGSAVVLWTGGKDSALALHEVRAAGRGVTALVTFAPLRASFRAHPVGVMRLQAKALRMQHRVFHLRPPFRAAYHQAFRELQREGVGAIVTGDIDHVGDRSNWVRSIAEPMGLEVIQPLWQRSRRKILGRLAELKFDVIVSYVDTSRLPREWVGRRLDQDASRDLEEEFRVRGIDPAGENGEYHTWVLDAPLFRSRLTPSRVAVVSSRNASWMRVPRLALVSKPTGPDTDQDHDGGP